MAWRDEQAQALIEELKAIEELADEAIIDSSMRRPGVTPKQMAILVSAARKVRARLAIGPLSFDNLEQARKIVKFGSWKLGLEE